MDSNYVFLCGVMWCKFGQKDAGKELLRAADSGDPDIKALAWAMFANPFPWSIRGVLSNDRNRLKPKLLVPGGGIYSLRFQGLKKNTSNIGKVQY